MNYKLHNEIVKLETLDVIMTSSVGDNQIDDDEII